MQEAMQYILRSGNTSTSMDKTCDRHISLWGSILSTDCGLYKQVSCCMQAIIHDRTTCCKSVQADILWVWLARHFSFWQWTMLHSRNFYKQDDRHITSSPHYPQSNGLAEKFVQIVKNLFYKAKVEGKDPFKSPMIYCNTSSTSSLQSLMQILQSMSPRSDLPMSNTARKQLGLDSEFLIYKHKNEHLPLHDLHLGQNIMFQDATSKQWFPATITSLCSQPVKLQDYYKRRCHLKKDISTLEAIHTTKQEDQRETFLITI